MAAGRPHSFLHVSRPDIDLPPGTPTDSPEAYALAAAAFSRLQADGMLVRDPSPRFHAYRMTSGDHTQTGIVGGASVAAYDMGRIRRHETTRPDKQADRAAQIEAVGAQTGSGVPDPPIQRTDRRDRRRRHRPAPRPPASTGPGRCAPRALADQRPGHRRRPGRRLRGAPRALHRRRPPPQRGGLDGPRPASHRGDRTVPGRGLPRRRGPDPGLQPAGPGPGRDGRRRPSWPACASASPSSPPTGRSPRRPRAGSASTSRGAGTG